MTEHLPPAQSLKELLHDLEYAVSGELDRVGPRTRAAYERVQAKRLRQPDPHPTPPPLEIAQPIPKSEPNLKPSTLFDEPEEIIW